MDSRIPRPSSARLSATLLFLLLAWAFLLRAWVATPDLTAGRYHDEMYGKENVLALLLDGQIRPANTPYPSLSYLPQGALLAASEGLHRATGADIFRVFAGRDDFSPTGYLLCRLLQAVFGTLSLYLTFLIGRRLFSPAVGLAGALALSAVEWHIRQSAIFKPDILLVLTCLLAFLWSLDAVEAPGWRRYARAGLGIGLALASKYNAAAVALPLCVGTLSNGPWRDRRRWAWLALAGVAAAATFVLLNPFFVLEPWLYVRDFGSTLRHYEDEGVTRQGSHWTMPWHAVRTLLSESYHGPVVGALALAGTLAVAIAVIWRPRTGDPAAATRRTGRIMALSFVVGYTLLYSLATTYASPHNWLPLAPFTALFAAWMACRIWRWLAARRPVLARPAVAAAAAVVLIVPLVLWAQRIAYVQVVPETWMAAERYLTESLEPVAGRLLYYEQGGTRLVLGYGRKKAIAVGVPRLDQIPPAALDRADAELFPGDRLSGESGDFYRRRVAATPPQGVVRVLPQLFRYRGPALALLLHPWRRAGDPMPVALERAGPAPRRLSGHLPPLAPGELGSLEVALPKAWDRRALGSLRLGDRELELVSLGGRLETFATSRFDAAEAGAPLLLRLQFRIPPRIDRLQVRLLRWTR
jgi:hypothetical protein